MRAACFLLLMASGTASAQSCRVYEYAELRDMRRDRLEQMFCDYGSDARALLASSLTEVRAGRLNASRISQGDANRCAQESERIERVLDNVHGAKRPQCAR